MNSNVITDVRIQFPPFVLHNIYILKFHTVKCNCWNILNGLALIYGHKYNTANKHWTTPGVLLNSYYPLNNSIVPHIVGTWKNARSKARSHQLSSRCCISAVTSRHIKSLWMLIAPQTSIYVAVIHVLNWIYETFLTTVSLLRFSCAL